MIYACTTHKLLKRMNMKSTDDRQGQMSKPYFSLSNMQSFITIYNNAFTENGHAMACLTCVDEFRVQSWGSWNLCTMSANSLVNITICSHSVENLLLKITNEVCVNVTRNQCWSHTTKICWKTIATNLCLQQRVLKIWQAYLVVLAILKTSWNKVSSLSHIDQLITLNVSNICH